MIPVDVAHVGDVHAQLEPKLIDVSYRSWPVPFG
jgi:hypothetical protein